jgi:hypothetical protein
MAAGQLAFVCLRLRYSHLLINKLAVLSRNTNHHEIIYVLIIFVKVNTVKNINGHVHSQGFFFICLKNLSHKKQIFVKFNTVKNLIPHPKIVQNMVHAYINTNRFWAFLNGNSGKHIQKSGRPSAPDTPLMGHDTSPPTPSYLLKSFSRKKNRSSSLAAHFLP